ncbi:hypothetical protein FIBSPDRAFT_864366 [Athelia psychrophila]|uniref:Uncharacterized protein n=1 Tax=Athelia psychrophila TaxID=1759441 RepID=A0A166GM21_9AGAM|nr:hypothetical protein FIBSPDRAFT_864366 [Fibularhizoctonia sp. CBS 109695]
MPCKLQQLTEPSRHRRRICQQSAPSRDAPMRHPLQGFEAADHARHNPGIALWAACAELARTI